MKWMALLSALFLSACNCTNSEVLESPQVTVASPKCNHIFMKPAHAIDVTTTTIKFY